MISVKRCLPVLIMVALFAISSAPHGNASDADSHLSGMKRSDTEGKSISGRVTDEDTEEGVADYWIEVWSGSTLVGEAVTDENGDYLAQGLPSAPDLAVVVWPPLGTDDYYYQFYNGKENRRESDPVSTEDADAAGIDFVLKKTSEYGIRGKVHNNRGGIAGVQVDIFSENLMYGVSTLTDEDGNYTFKGLKSATDYKVSVWSETFRTDFYYAIPATEKVGAYVPVYSVFLPENATFVTPQDPPAEQIDIITDPPQSDWEILEGIWGEKADESDDSLWGYVRNTNGTPITDAVVKIWSDTLDAEIATVTDRNGYYVINGFQGSRQNAYPTNDCVVTVYSESYPPQSKAQKRVGNEVNFVLTTGEVNSLSGTVRDYRLKFPPNDVTVVVMVFKQNGEFMKRGIVNKGGKFTIIGLNGNEQYYLSFKTLDGEIPSQWARGQSGIGVNQFEKAGLCKTGETVLFVFNRPWDI
ncbi:carboxypeptidase-like regulatory domain-containing protein [Desulfococcaceae bacterium HSG8]|nr:carboxypeptidase-like regulatory domain-containing protein [Desulfococcaceae bacterium HSG8]